MKPKVFIDGEHGTTGLQIRQRLARRDDLNILSLEMEDRRDNAKRSAMLNEADLAILCLPDDAARKQRLLDVFGVYETISDIEAEALAALFNLPANLGDDMTPDAQRDITRSALSDVLNEIALQQPLVCTWEDLHWADASTLDLLEELLHSSQGSKMMSIFTFFLACKIILLNPKCPI